jgi:hypothetical protein
MIVLMYHRRFVAPIKAKVKRHTIRRDRKRPINVGDKLSHRSWTGKAYRSKQEVIAEGTCTAVVPITVGTGCVWYAGGHSGPILSLDRDLDAFAVSDGFKDWADLQAYYVEQKISLPFRGVLIEWE